MPASKYDGYERMLQMNAPSLRASSPIWARVLARLVLLAQIGELARRLECTLKIYRLSAFSSRNIQLNLHVRPPLV